MDLGDAKTLLDQAKRHYAEFEDLTGRRNGSLWSFHFARDDRTGKFTYSLTQDRKRLVAAAPLVSDCANNVASALDHISAAITKARGFERKHSPYFPVASDDAKFKEKLDKTRKVYGDEWANIIDIARTQRRHEADHLQAAKEISNSGKHWRLLHTKGNAPGVALNVPGQPQRIFEVPKDAFVASDIFEFHRNKNPLPEGYWLILFGLTVDGLDEGLPTSPDSIFPCAFRFVEAMIEAVESSAVPKDEVRRGTDAPA